MSDRAEFEKWANQFDHSGDEWEDMGRDEIFKAGMQAARKELGLDDGGWSEWIAVSGPEDMPTAKNLVGEWRGVDGSIERDAELWNVSYKGRTTVCAYRYKLPPGGWIKCSESLPAEKQDVLIYPTNWHLGDEPVYTAHRSGNSWKYIWAGSIYSTWRLEVTHWMKRPQPPQQEGEGDE